MECLFEDLHENPENYPRELLIVVENMERDYENGKWGYEVLKAYAEEAEKVGYTFDYDLSGEPYDLRRKKIQVEKIEIVRGEGPSDKCGIKKVFDSFDKANTWMAYQNDSYPKSGYDKHKYKITWKDGGEYEGRLDAVHPDNEYYDLRSNCPNCSAEDFLKYCLGIEEFAASAREMLDKYEFK